MFSRCEGEGPSAAELPLTEALAELNTVMNSMLQKMHDALPEMAEISIMWILGLKALAEQQAAVRNQESIRPMPVEDARPVATSLRRYGALADAVYNSSPEDFWADLNSSAGAIIDRGDLQMLLYDPTADRENPAHALLLDHKSKEILIVIRCVMRELMRV